MRRYGFVGGSMSLWGWALKSHICSSHSQGLRPLPVACKSRCKAFGMEDVGRRLPFGTPHDCVDSAGRAGISLCLGD